MMDADNKEDYSVKDWTREQRWIVCVSAVSVFMSVFASFFHVFNQNFAGSKMELGLVRFFAIGSGGSTRVYVCFKNQITKIRSVFTGRHDSWHVVGRSSDHYGY